MHVGIDLTGWIISLVLSLPFPRCLTHSAHQATRLAGGQPGLDSPWPADMVTPPRTPPVPAEHTPPDGEHHLSSTLHRLSRVLPLPASTAFEVRAVPQQPPTVCSGTAWPAWRRPVCSPISPAWRLLPGKGHPRARGWAPAAVPVSEHGAVLMQSKHGLSPKRDGPYHLGMWSHQAGGSAARGRTRGARIEFVAKTMLLLCFPMVNCAVSALAICAPGIVFNCDSRVATISVAYHSALGQKP